MSGFQTSIRTAPERGGMSWVRWGRPALPILVVSVLLCLGLANIVSRATWREMEDGVLWRLTGEGVVASEIADQAPAAAVGLKRGDLLLAIDDRPVQQVSDVVAALHAASEGSSVRYTVLRLGSREVVDVRIAPVPNGSGSLYFLLAAVGIFTLLVGGAVRLRRPRDQATLHFFWLAVAFFGVFTFSFSGRLDRLDWIFYWGDVASILLLPPLFLHFALVFPERPRRWTTGVTARALFPLIYIPAALLGRGADRRAHPQRQRRGAVRRGHRDDRSPRAGVPGGVLRRRPCRADPRARRGAVGDGAPAAPLDCVGHGTRRGALRVRLRAALRGRASSRRCRWACRRSR